MQRIADLTRALHASMHELGLDKQVEQAARAIPDARDRLEYIAAATQQAADRALSAIEVAQPVQTLLAERARALSERWAKAPPTATRAEGLVAETRSYLDALPAQTRIIGAQLHEILMAQDFQDLTGQVIMKLVELIHRIERELLEVLVEHHEGEEGAAPGDAAARGTRLDGPQVRPGDHPDVVTDQAQVDALLEQMGF